MAINLPAPARRRPDAPCPQRLVPAFAAVVVMATLSACQGPQSALDPAGPSAEAIGSIWWSMLAGATLVWALVVWSAWHAISRRRPALRPAGGRRLIVVGGILLPALVLMALLVHGAASSDRITGDSRQVSHVVDVRARQWQWTFEYRDGVDGGIVARSEDVLLMPRGEWVEFRVHGEDVIHSFWIPRLGGKIDVIPGRINTLRLRADRGGRISGQCAEFCGLDHAHMRFDVHVVEPGDYAAWLHADGDPGLPRAVW